MDVKHRLLVSLVTVAVIVAGLGSSESYAETPSANTANMSGNTWLPKCKQAIASLDQKDGGGGSGGTACVAYLRGVWEGTMFAADYAALMLLNPKNPADAEIRRVLFWCGPKPVDYGQALRVTVKYMEDHPEQLHSPLMDLALASWVQAFPCKQSGAK